MSDLSGQTIKGYELHNLLGAGGFGAVYRAYQPLIKRDVALKIILPEYANHPDFIRRFEFEAQLVARLEHIHIVPLYDYWREPDGAFLVMRLLQGGSLRDRLKKSGPVENATTSQVVNQIASALALAHRRGVVHRDLKPDNVLFDEEGNAFLADFGIAKDLREANVDDAQEGALTGSPFYLSPEQAQNQPISPQTDIYSLGIVVYEMLTGQPPFLSDQGLMAILSAHINKPVPSINDLRPDLPVSVDVAIQRATAKDPSSRFATVTDLANDLEIALVGAEPRTDDGIIISPEGFDGAEMDDLLVVTKPLSASTMIIVPGTEVVNPYKGLQAFQEADAGDFFGRKELIAVLLERLQDPGDISRFLAVIGPSGSGKSSVVKAGLLPALRQGALDGSDRWYFVEMVPGADPFVELANALLTVAVAPPENIQSRLRASENGLVEIAQQIVPEGSELLLVIDQFEEVFTMVADESERAHFLQSLLLAIAEPACRIRLIVTLRADFYDRPLLYPGFGEMVRRRNEVVLPLSPDEMREAIVGPANKSGLTVETGLVAAIVAEVAEQPGALPLMQYALTELFERRQENTLTLDAYHQTGGVLGALARRAEELYQDSSPEHQAAMEQLFLRLVTIGEGMDDTRRRASQVELMSVIDDDKLVTDLLDTLGKYRLLTFDHDPETRIPTIEVAHEALIREWERLRGWLDDNRDALLLQRKLLVATAEWNANNHDVSYLATGLQLQRYEMLLTEDSSVALTQAETEYIRASAAERERKAAIELARQQREQRMQQIIKWGAIAASVIFLSLAVVAVLNWFEAEDQRDIAEEQRGIAEDQRDIAEEQRGIAEEQRDIADEQRGIAERNAEVSDSLALVANSQKELDAHNTDLAITLALKANEMTDPPVEAVRMLERAIFTPGTRSVFSEHGTYVFSVAYSPDGTQAISGDFYGTVLLWDVASGEVIRQFGPDNEDTEELEGHQSFLRTVAFAPDGKTLVSGSTAGRMILWDAASGEIVHVFEPDNPETDVIEGHSKAVRQAIFTHDGHILTASDDYSLGLWDIATGELLRQYGPDNADTEDVVEGHTERVRGVALSPDGTTMVSASYDGTLMLWDVETGEILQTFVGHDDKVATVAFSPDGTQIVSGAADRTIRLWNVETGEEIRQMQGHGTWVKSISFRSDGKVLLSSSDDQTIRLWNVETGDEIARFSGHAAFVEQAVYSPDESQILSASGDGTVRLWDIPNGAEARRFVGHTEGVLQVAISPDGTTAATGAFDNTIRVWDVATGEERLVFEGHSGYPNMLLFSPDGQWLISSGTGNWEEEPSAANEILIWDAATGEIAHRLIGHRDWPVSGAFSPDGSTFISGSKDTTIIVWNLENDSVDRQIGEPQQEYLWVNDVQYSPDGRFVAAAIDSEDPVAVLWDAETWEQVRRFEGHEAAVNSVSFTPDGKTLTTGSEDTTVRLWDVETGEQLKVLEGHQSTVIRARFSPDGTLIASGSYDGTVRLWEPETGSLIRVLENGPSVWGVAYHPDGQHVLTGAEDSTARLWNAVPLTQDDLLAWAFNNRYIYELTCGERELFRTEPKCDADGVYPTSTPYPGG